MSLTYDQAFQAMRDRGYGPVSARGLLHYVTVHGEYTDEWPTRADGTRPGVQIATVNNAGTRFIVRDVTLVSVYDEAGQPAIPGTLTCPVHGYQGYSPGCAQCYRDNPRDHGRR